MASETAYTRVTYKGVTVNARTRDALRHAQKLWRKRMSDSSLTIELSQGSYNRGGVSASAGTHDGGGSVDIRVRGLSRDERVGLVVSLKRAGFAAWYRKPSSSWGPHIHAVANDDKEASSGARNQVTSFHNGRDGLRGNRVDDTYRPDPAVRFSYKKGKPVPR